MDEIEVSIDELTDLELIELYMRILEHIKFLDNSILEEDKNE